MQYVTAWAASHLIRITMILLAGFAVFNFLFSVQLKYLPSVDCVARLRFLEIAYENKWDNAWCISVYLWTGRFFVQQRKGVC